ncbi:hypothetical protein B0H11DRAFT_613848 [Mycena galericulata]|nr:hypothetical protein B0H11DRAFT_613848 [Mycena galericulata]
MSSPDAPPAKRQRTENAPLTRSDVWYQDGSVVLQAQNMQFRVHWGVLSKHSSFFRDMQGLPQPPNQPSVDGCPMVELADSAEDVKYLLEALYNPTFLAQMKLPFPAIAALVRLGRKYDFLDLLKSAVEWLTFDNPSTIEEYDASFTATPYAHERKSIIVYPGLSFDILTLAREHDILSVLPFAYYRVIYLSDQAALFDGVSRGDGTSATLAPIDVRKCVLGREGLVQSQWKTQHTAGWLKSQASDGCTRPQTCGLTRESYLSTMLTSGALVTLWSPSAAALFNFCDVCKHRTEASISVGRKKMWDALPSFFDLPPWGELKNDL